jgi:hypothetical protein
MNENHFEFNQNNEILLVESFFHNSVQGRKKSMKIRQERLNVKKKLRLTTTKRTSR